VIWQEKIRKVVQEMKKFIVDSFDARNAVCETEQGTVVNIPRSNLPEDVKEGDYIILNADGTYSKDEEGTKKRKKHMNKKFRKLFS
jgi:hypothetical protein